MRLYNCQGNLPGELLLTAEQRDLKSQHCPPFLQSNPWVPGGISLSSQIVLCLAQCHSSLATSSACKPLMEASHHIIARSLFLGAPTGRHGLSLHWGRRPLCPLLSRAPCYVGADLSRLVRATCAHVFPASCSVMSH